MKLIITYLLYVSISFAVKVKVSGLFKVVFAVDINVSLVKRCTTLGRDNNDTA